MRKTDDPAIPSPDDVLQAEAFSKYFIKKVNGIRQCFHVAPDPDYVPSDDGNFNAFAPTTVEKTKHLTAVALNKHCLLNPIPTALIKNCATLLGLFLSQRFNRSLSEVCIPAMQKVAVLKPLLKKLDKEDRKCYRPVSNLTFASNFLERIVSEQLTTFLGTSNALPESQSAYRRFHSIESALLNVFFDLNNRSGTRTQRCMDF